MEIGANTQSVTVTASLTGVETNETVVGETLSNQTLVDTPFGGRNYTDVMQLVPGVLGEDSINATGDVNSTAEI